MVIIGYSGHAYVVIDAISSSGDTIEGYFDKNQKTTNPYNLEYLGEESVEIIDKKKWHIAIGNNRLRATIYTRLSLPHSYTTVIHNKSIVSQKSKVMNGSFIAAGVVINPLVEIGLGVIVNTNATVEHECIIKDFAHIAPGATLAGNVVVGERSFIGANAVVKEGIEIGSDVIVGAGAVIVKNIPNACTIVGNPGKIIKQKQQ